MQVGMYHEFGGLLLFMSIWGGMQHWHHLRLPDGNLSVNKLVTYSNTFSPQPSASDKRALPEMKTRMSAVGVICGS